MTFLILGVLAYGAGTVADVNLVKNASSLDALANANHALGVAITSDLQQRGACTLAASTCVQQYLTTLNGDFATFQTTLSGISFPSSASGDAAHLGTDTANLIALLNQMTSGKSAIAAGQLSQLQSLANTFDADYSQVVADLTGSL